MVKGFTAQMQIGSSILSEHKLAGLIPSRSKRKNHNSTGINLLAVPRYNDLLEDMDAEDESDRGRALVTTEASWRMEMAKWIGEARAEEVAEYEAESENENVPAATTSHNQVSKPKPIAL